jgi:NAD(P)-dependent dehydrogenase (short-subunit alcohol dehydrogenase family)
MSYILDLSGRVALITGASSGLGKQFALTLAQAGAAVVLAGRRVELLKTLRSEIEASGGDAHVVGLDVTDLASIRSAVAHAETEVGPIDILVNNSGVSTTERLVDVTEESYDFVFDTNTRGAFFVAQEVAKRMLARAKGAAPGTYTGVLHEQGCRHPHDQGDGRGVGAFWHYHERHLSRLHRHRDQPPSLVYRSRPEAGQHAAAQASGQPGRLGCSRGDVVFCQQRLHQWRGHFSR